MNDHAWKILEAAVWIAGVPAIAVLVWRAIRQVRDIHALDAQVRAEEEQNAANPYAQMQMLVDETRRSGRTNPNR